MSVDLCNDNDLREEAIRSLLPLVKRVARRIHRMVSHLDLDDLIGDGSIGAIRAVDRYQTTRGTTLEQYAGKVIAGTILNGIRRWDPLSERARRELRDARREQYLLAGERGAMPTEHEMEQRRGKLSAARAAAVAAQPYSLDAALPDDEVVPPYWQDDPAQIFERMIQREQVIRAVAHLPGREQSILRRHYYDECSLRSLALEFAISPQRLSQLHRGALTRMRRELHAAAH